MSQLSVRTVSLGLLVLGACTTRPSYDEDVIAQEGKKPPPPPVDAAVVDSAPDAAPDAPPAEAPYTDACALPGAAVATLIPYGSIDGNDEGSTAALPLPFAFTLHGTSHTRYWVTSNGELGFGDAPGGVPFGNIGCPLPSAATAKPVVFAYGVDLMGGTVCMATTGSAPSRQLVITWKDRSLYELDGTGNGTSKLTFGVTLTEGTNAVSVGVHRVSMSSVFFPTADIAKGSWAVLGLQSAGGATSFSCHETKAPQGATFSYVP